MKITLNIDDALVERVRMATGAKTKTEAIHIALSEIDRRNRLKELLAEDFDLSANDWRNSFEPSSEIEEYTAKVAEEPPVTYVSKSSPR